MKKNKFHFIDAQQSTPHLLSMGAEEISRKKYLKLLKKAMEDES
jgi:Leu/Phe-tRNA-protein transferase